MSAAETFKEEGNAEFRKGNYQLAWAKYDAAAKLDNSVPVYLGNRAQCELKLEEFGSAIATCTQALAIDDTNVKCYMRRAAAYNGTLQHAKAVKDLQAVVRLQPSAEATRKLKLAQALARYVAFQAAIRTEDEPSIFERLDLGTLPETDGELTELELDLERLELAGIERLIAHFKAGKRLARRRCLEIVKRVHDLLANEPPLLEVAVPAGGTVTVCGDTHGQFYDVLHIFEQNGLPSPTHTYVFNGDFVDRGSWSTEVALLLYTLKLLFPQNVFLNRGNHETDSMNTIYGFSGECKAKYGTETVFKAFSESFTKLPVATLIADAYFVVHGGVASESVIALDDVRKLDRSAERQPSTSGLLLELLWSDPQPEMGLAPSKRGISHMFGPDVTTRFVEHNKLRKVIRSHEVRERGYEEEHGGKLVTIFSAPNYCDSVGNQGAYINIGEDLELQYTQFGASPHPNVPPMAYASGLMR